MFEIVALGATESIDPPRELLVAVIDDISRWPRTVPVDSPFVVCTAFDAGRISDQALRSFAGTLLDQGCAYACAWGHDCERVHDAFDLERDTANRTGTRFDGLVMTTWHPSESFREALWFATYLAWPPHGEIAAVLVVTTPEYAADAQAHLRSPEAL